MAGELASDHASYLRGRMGRDSTPGEFYAAHVLGPKGTATLIEAVRSHPSATAAPFFPQAAAANRGLFYRDGRAESVGELYADLTRDPTAGTVATPATETFTQYAAARRIDHETQGRALTALAARAGRNRATTGAPGRRDRCSLMRCSALTTDHGEQ